MEKRRRRGPKNSATIDSFTNAEDPPGFQKVFIDENIGWGVFATQRFKKDDFLLIYKGTLLKSKEAETQENEYNKEQLGSYMFYFKHGTETMCIDATTDDGSLGRLANDGWRGYDNCAMKKQIHAKDGHPYLALFAKRDIEIGEQLLYDYGVGELPWRESKTKIPRSIDQIRRCSAPTEETKAPFNTQRELGALNDVTNQLTSSDNVGEALAAVDALVSSELMTRDTEKEEVIQFNAREDEPTEPTVNPAPANSQKELDVLNDVTNQLTSSDNVGEVLVAVDALVSSELMTRDAQKEEVIEFNAKEDEPTEPTVNPAPANSQKEFDVLIDVTNQLTGNDNVGDEVLAAVDALISSEHMTFNTEKAEVIESNGMEDEPTESAVNQDIRTSTPIKGKDDGATGRNVVDVMNISQFRETGTFDLAFDQQDVEETEHLPKPDMPTSTHFSPDGSDPSVTNCKDGANQNERDQMQGCQIRKDTFCCGSCGDQFHSVEDFLEHKKNPCEPNVNKGVSAEADSRSAVVNIKESKPELENNTNHDKVKSKKTKENSSIYPNVTVPIYQARADGSRTYDKRQACYFCCQLISKMTRHLERCHSEETAVAKVLATSDKDLRGKEFERLRHMGNFNHNIKILQKREGSLIIARRPGSHRNAEEYLPCLHCLSFIHEDEIWRHTKNCFFKPTSTNTDADEFGEDDGIDNVMVEDCDNKKTDDASDLIRNNSVRIQCRMFLEGAAKADIPMFEDYQSLKDNVISRMRSGIVKSVVEKDQMILKFGSILLNKIGSKRNYLIAQRMRQLGRLLVEFRQLHKSPCSLYEILDGQYFDQVIKATKVLCKAGDGTTMNGVSLLGTPSIGLHIGHSLKKCALIKQGIGLRQQRNETLDEARRFIDLFNAEWTENISSHALQSLKERRYNATELLPVTSDVLTLKDHSARELLRLEKELAEYPSQTTWRRLSEAIFTSVTLFNKRRGGEVAKMHTTCFVKRPSWRDVGNEDILLSLSPLEKRLLKSLDMVHLPGKRDRKVPLLIKQEWVKPMQLLVDNRVDCGVESEYYFGVPGRKTHLSPWKVLNAAAVNAGCKCPDLISTTRLRKYTATVTQVLGLREGELEWLSNHMGHTVDIHKQSYRLHESTIEMAKVSKILLAIDSGNVGRFQGKSLSDIDLDQIELPDEIYAEDEDQDAIEDDADEENAMIVEGDNTQGGTSEKKSLVGATSKTKKPKGVKKDAQVSKVVRKVRAKQMVERKRNALDECEQDNRTVAEESSPRKRPKRNVKKVVSLEPNMSESDGLDDSFLDKDYENVSSEPETDSGNESLLQPNPTLVKQKRKKPQSKWSNEEVKAVEDGFQRNLLNKRIPRKDDIERVIDKWPVLKKRSVAQIKSKVQHLINRGENIKNTLFRKVSEKC